MQNRIKDLRREKGLSQFALGKLANITPTEISRIENGLIHAYPGWRRRLADALGVPEGELFPEEAQHGGK